MKSGLVSVIIPIYNVEKYLRHCINSILEQTYKNIEIILVNDGSTDSSGIICDEYQEKYKNIMAIHKKNGGLVSARKRGAKVAKGEYVLCVDGDDWIEREMVAYLYDIITYNKCDIVTANMIKESERREVRRCSLKPGLYDLEKDDNLLYRHFFVDDAGIGVLHGICGKIINTNLYKMCQRKVPENICIGEDAACMYPCYLKSNKVYITEKVFYHYRQRKDSILHKISKDKLSNLELLFNFLQDNIKFNDIDVQKIVNENLEKFIYQRIVNAVNCRFSNIVQSNKDSILKNIPYGIFRFSYKNIIKNSKVVLYGAGKVGQSYYRQIQEDSYCYLKGIYDSYSSGSVGGFIIQKPDKLLETSFDYVIIAVLKESMAIEIAKMLKQKGVSEEKIIWEKPEMYYVEQK